MKATKSQEPTMSSESAVQAAPSAPEVAAAPLAERSRTPELDLRIKKQGPAMRVVSVLASLRLTVLLFVLSIFLVLAGTLAQVDLGIWTVVAKYFRSLFVWIPFQIFFPRDWKI